MHGGYRPALNHAGMVARMRLRKTPIVVAYWKAHRWAYRASGGRIGQGSGRRKSLLLTTTGRKSGEKRHVALTYLEDGDAFVVVASYLGEPHNPAWYLNLQANPQATVRIGTREFAVLAREAEGEERERLFGRFDIEIGGYQAYADQTQRRIPVVVLEHRITASS